MKTNFDFTRSGSFYIDEDGDFFVKDSKGNVIYSKDSDSFELWFEYDKNNNEIHFKNSDGDEEWQEYDEHHTLIHYKTSNGLERWYDSDGNKITKQEFDSTNSK